MEFGKLSKEDCEVIDELSDEILKLVDGHHYLNAIVPALLTALGVTFKEILELPLGDELKDKLTVAVCRNIKVYLDRSHELVHNKTGLCFFQIMKSLEKLDERKKQKGESWEDD